LQVLVIQNPIVQVTKKPRRNTNGSDYSMNEINERYAIETMRVTAKMAHEFYGALLEQGFTSAEAMFLVVEWLKAAMAPKK